MIKICVLGNGQLGQILVKELFKLGYEVTNPKDRWPINFVLQSDWKDIFSSDIVINTIAISNTRECQKNWEKSLETNVRLPIRLAQMLQPQQKLIHISTGCIFDGNKKPVYENDAPTPLIAYSRQKLMAESIQFMKENLVMIRPRMIFSDLNIKSNLIKKISTFPTFIDEMNSMTCAYDIVNFVDIICKNDLKGIFNFCNKNMSSPKEIKMIINDKYDIHDPVFQMTKEQLHKSLGMNLTNTWITSNNLSQHYNMPDVHKRLIEMIEKSTWLKK